MVFIYLQAFQLSLITILKVFMQGGYNFEKKEETMVREEDTSLSYVLHALQRMQDEIDKINNKLNT